MLAITADKGVLVQTECQKHPYKREFIEFLKHRHRDSFAAPFDGMDYLKTVCFQPLYLPIKIVKRSNG